METINGGIPVVRKYKDKKHTKLLYMTYVLSFPDGDQWVKQQAFSAHDLSFELNKIRQEHKNTLTDSSWRNRTEALWKTGECWWKDEAGVEHLIIIEENKRKNMKWGVSKDGYMDLKTGLTEEQMNELSKGVKS